MSTSTVVSAEAPVSQAPQPSRRRSVVNPRTPLSWVVLALVSLGALLTVFPFYLAAVNAFKTPRDYLAGGPLGLPTTFSLENVTSFWESVNFTQKLWNSVLISGSVAILAVALSLLTSYAIGIGRIRGRYWVLALFMIAFTIPQEALVYPLYVMAKAVGIYDTKLSIIIVLAVLQSAFGTYMLSSVMTTFPPQLLEAAELDGAGRFRVLWSVVIPLSRPTMTVLGTFFFIWTWNEFMLPLILLPSAANQTVSVSLGTLFGQYTANPVSAAAAALVGILPAIVFFLIFQRTLMRGVTVGAEK